MSAPPYPAPSYPMSTAMPMPSQPIATEPPPGGFTAPKLNMPQAPMLPPGMIMPPGITAPPGPMMPSGPMMPPQNINMTVPEGGWSASNTTCPPGLEYLTALDQLYIKQEIDVLEVITNWERANKYSVMNLRGQIMYYVVEKSDFCPRMCCGTNRNCEFKVYDGAGREILSMQRPLRCDSCLCPCCLQELEVYSGGVLLGTVTQDWSCWRPWFSVQDSTGNTVLRIHGPWIRCCVNVNFKVKSADGNYSVGMISKKWSGFAREAYTDADNFGISFPMDLDVKMKAVLLGACLLIDFMYFENK